jgi:hypothetical protein
MSDSNSQITHVPLESWLENRHIDTNINRLLAMGVVTTDQTLLEGTTTTAIGMNTTRQVQTVALQINPTTRQLARRRQRQRQRHHWIPISPPRHRVPTDNTLGNWAQRRPHGTFWNTREWENVMDQPMDSSGDEMLLEAYNLERIDPRDRLEQEQLYELEGFAVLEHLQLMHDQIEQQEKIDAEELLEQER